MTADEQKTTAETVRFRSDVSVKLIDSMGNDRALAEAAWVSTTDDAIVAQSKTDDDVEGLIRYLMRHKHGTPFEHAALKFRVQAPIFVWREHHRHRIGFSYNEESGRYKKLEPEFYVPRKARTQTGKPGSYQIVSGNEEQTQQMEASLRTVATLAYDEYEHLLKAGVAREVARMCLPVNIYSTCYVTMNPRSLMNFCELRSAAAACAEIRAVAESYLRALSDLFPVTYEAFMQNGQIAP